MTDANSAGHRLYSWRNSAAIALLELERPAASEEVKKSKKFQCEAKKAIKLHRALVEKLDPHPMFGPPDPVAIAGAWSNRDDNPSCSVMRLPAMKRLTDAEEHLADLGRLLSSNLSGIFVTAGPDYSALKIVWCTDDNAETDITCEEDLLDLLLYLRTDDALNPRWREISAALEQGRMPPPPAFAR